MLWILYFTSVKSIVMDATKLNLFKTLHINLTFVALLLEQTNNSKDSYISPLFQVTSTFICPHNSLKQLKAKAVITCKVKNVVFFLCYQMPIWSCLFLAYLALLHYWTQRQQIKWSKTLVVIHFNALKHNQFTLRYIGMQHVSVPRWWSDTDNVTLITWHW